MVQDLQTAKSNAPNRHALSLADGIVSSFEKHMNNDLDVKNAFKALFANVFKLHELAKKKQLSAQDASVALRNLRKVDGVLQVIF
jgi:cysteinyl-tRNA synthetase